MGDIRITASVDGGDDLKDALERAVNEGTELRVRHEQGACAPCRMNQDPHNVPFWGCNGNIDRIDPDEGLGNLCRCTVVLASGDARGRAFR